MSSSGTSSAVLNAVDVDGRHTPGIVTHARHQVNSSDNKSKKVIGFTRGMRTVTSIWHSDKEQDGDVDGRDGTPAWESHPNLRIIIITN